MEKMGMKHVPDAKKAMGFYVRPTVHAKPWTAQDLLHHTFGHLVVRHHVSILCTPLRNQRVVSLGTRKRRWEQVDSARTDGGSSAGDAETYEAIRSALDKAKTELSQVKAVMADDSDDAEALVQRALQQARGSIGVPCLIPCSLFPRIPFFWPREAEPPAR